MVEGAFLAIAFIGIMHGLEPGHGWPVAMLYATRSSRPLFRGLVSSWIIAAFHLVSSIAVVAAFVMLNTLVGFTIPYLNFIAGGALLILAARFLLEKPKGVMKEQHGHVHRGFEGEHEHEHKHQNGMRHTHKHGHARKIYLTLPGLAVFAFVLGFVHEEEFVLLAFAVGGIDPLSLMLTYASAVMIGLIGITLTAVKIYDKLEPRLEKYEHLIPKVSGLVLILMAISFFVGLR